MWGCELTNIFIHSHYSHLASYQSSPNILWSQWCQYCTSKCIVYYFRNSKRVGRYIIKLYAYDVFLSTVVNQTRSYMASGKDGTYSLFAFRNYEIYSYILEVANTFFLLGYLFIIIKSLCTIFSLNNFTLYLQDDNFDCVLARCFYSNGFTNTNFIP